MKKPLPSFFAVLVLLSMTSFAQKAPIVDRSVLANAHSKTFHPTPHDLTNGRAHARFGIHGIDSIPNFNGQFFAPGLDGNGNPNRHWYTNTLGNPPQMGRTTLINAPIVPVSIELDDVNGHLLIIGGKPMISDATQFVAPVLGSPVFSTHTYSSGAEPTQFSDSIQRAEYYNSMKPDWHTLLVPSPQANVTLHYQQSATCEYSYPYNACNYVLALNRDGSCCFFILVNDNPPDFVFDTGLGNIVGDAITNNVITTKDVASFLYPNVYIFFGDITQCCVLGYHTYFYDPSTDPQQRWVLNYASWISPGLFGSAFTDVTGLSHEISETYNDPFVVSDGVHNLTPWWLSPNGNCQDDLETGDVIEGLPDATFPVVLNGFTYHPQNEALLQWFKFESPSSALDGAYSYPDRTVLTQPSTPQNVYCVP